MIKVEDLRIKNYVLYNGIVVQVWGIIPPAPREDERYGDGYLLELFEGASTITAKLEDVSAIKLNKDWFDKFSFQFFDGGIGWNKYSKDKVEIVLVPTDKGLLPGFFIGGEYTYLQSVHKLQNLYYSLKVKELKL